MQVLGIDTSCLALALGIVNDDKVIFDLVTDSGIPEGEDIIEIMRYWIKDLNQIDGFAVSIGPGSYTGLRVGLSTVKGLAFGLMKPVVGVPTLDAFVTGFPYVGYTITPVIDTRRGDVYTASYQADGKRITSYRMLKAEEFIDSLEGKHLFTGSGVEVYSSQIKKKLGKKAHFISPNITFPRGSWIANLGLKRIKEGNFDALDSLQPIYIKK